MSFVRRSERNRKNYPPTRPTLLDKVAAYYIDQVSRHPSSIRVSFSDGSTAVYDLHVEQPAPVVEAIGYQWKGGSDHESVCPGRRHRMP